jgi:hypothetical protein
MPRHRHHLAGSCGGGRSFNEGPASVSIVADDLSSVKSYLISCRRRDGRHPGDLRRSGSPRGRAALPDREEVSREDPEAGQMAGGERAGVAEDLLPVRHRCGCGPRTCLERLNEEIKRRTPVPDLFPNEAASLRLVLARSPASLHRAAERRLDSRSCQPYPALATRRNSCQG